MKRFSIFCERYQVSDPFPVTEVLLCSFAAYLADDGLATQTVKSYLAAIRNAALPGSADPREKSSLPVLKRVLARVRLPITASLLCKIREELDRTVHPERRVLWAVCCTAISGFFRLGELLLTSQSQFNPRLHLSWGDMAVNNPKAPSMLKFHLHQSKTDPVGHGVDVVLGKTGCNLCPVAAVLSYVCVGPGQSTRSIFHNFNWSTTVKAGVCGRDMQCAIDSGSARSSVRGPQFPNRCSNICSSCRHRRFHHSAPRPVAEFSIPSLYEDSPQEVNSSLSVFGFPGAQRPCWSQRVKLARRMYMNDESVDVRTRA